MEKKANGTGKAGQMEKKVIYNNVANFAADFGNDRISESTPAQFHSI
jgi:hypothetical protein